MKFSSHLNVRWSVLIATSVGLLAVGAGATYVGLRSGGRPEPPPDRAGTPGAHPPEERRGGAGPTPLPGGSASRADIVVKLSPAAIERAGITAVAVIEGIATGGLRAPGVVEPNAYKQVTVTPLVSGRVTRVMAELGQHVRRNDALAQIFSPELAEAQARYISVRAGLEAHDQELARTETLVKIGAASRQELERIHAEHTARRAEVQSAASRLELLGLPAGAVADLGPDAPVATTIIVPAPVAGVITEREANVGLNVDLATKLFTVVDLSTVWIVVELYEQDFARVGVGTAATITTPAYPNLVRQGRVSYIDPQVNPETRTARVRVEVPNARGELRLGIYAEAQFDVGGGARPMIPRGAVQHIDDRTVVYLVDPAKPGTFVEREVRLGATSGHQVPVLSGLQTGDVVVGAGSFYVRAERERLGLRQP